MSAQIDFGSHCSANSSQKIDGCRVDELEVGVPLYLFGDGPLQSGGELGFAALQHH
jgi:hypothetical protein